MENSIFETLNNINVNDKVEKKNGLTYLSWAWAWGEVKKKYPLATYKIYENTLPNGYVVNYFTDGHTAWVKTGVIINDLEHIEYLPVMNYKNKSIPLEELTSFDVNTAIQRSLTKAVARHGLGLYIYAGEDLPEDEKKEPKKEEPKEQDHSKRSLTGDSANMTIDQLKELESLGYTMEQVVVKLNKPTTKITFNEMEEVLKKCRLQPRKENK